MDGNHAWLEVRDLSVTFGRGRVAVHAVDGVDLALRGPETVALVGESGCGKSVTALALTRLVLQSGESIRGHVWLHGRDLLAMRERELRDIRGRVISYVFQEPATSLNPVMSVGAQIAEAIRLHRGAVEVADEVVRLMRLVGFTDPERQRRQYPHQFSGGMQQRAMIAMALACHPQILVADEPTTALDVTIQAQIFQLLAALQAELGMAILLITHNLGLVAAHASRLYVMYAGQIVERGSSLALLRAPEHPYTRGLLAAVPRLRRARARLKGIEGTVPSGADWPRGCRFHPRCPRAVERCRQEAPVWERVAEDHEVRCHCWRQST
mgnify:CR=1 FL=1